MGHPCAVRGRRRRSYLISATAEGGECIKRCAGVSTGHRALINTANKRKRKRDVPELFDEMVWEILIRLPVNSLVRFRSVSKAWRAIISDPSFVRAHLHFCRQSQHQNPTSFLITPYMFLQRRGPATSKAISTDIRFYKWHLEEDTRNTATLVYRRHFPAGEFGRLSEMAHCDGLVLLPTNTKAYVFNPGTRDVIVLPESTCNALPLHRTCLPTGLGFDATTGRYKVARAFYRPSYDDPMYMAAMGMEVFTIGGEDGAWRETLEDPPYLMLSGQTAAHCKGCLFFFIDKKNYQSPPQGLIRFSLQDETFGVTPLLPYVLPQVEDKDVVLSELHGELCASFFSKPLQRLLIWTTEDVLDDPPWICRYMIDVPDHQYHPMASHGSGGILFQGGNCLLRYDLEAQDIREEDGIHEMDRLTYVGLNRRDKLGRTWKNLRFFNLISYTESLVPLTAKRQGLQALQ
ncbi:unnamed protein product [Urochloa decumbens]|uniref:F-box domain-containing protein n=1 Tax=Urochloa decumbens TaxID=240449 RepID=A0ABC8ZHR9_9POAL